MLEFDKLKMIQVFNGSLRKLSINASWQPRIANLQFFFLHTSMTICATNPFPVHALIKIQL